MSEPSVNVSSPRSRSALDTRTVACLGMLCAVAYVVMYISKTLLAPIRFGGFLTLDMKDTIIAISGFLFGPIHAFAVSVVTSLIEMVTHSETGPVGLLMNVLSSCAFVCPAAWLYQKRRHSLSGAVQGLALGVVSQVLVMLLWNYLVTPLYQHIPRDVVAGMLLPVFLPFNLIKSVLNSAFTLILYKPVVTALRKANLAPESRSGDAASTRGGVILLCIVVAASAILLSLVLTDVI